MSTRLGRNPFEQTKKAVVTPPAPKAEAVVESSAKEVSFDNLKTSRILEPRESRSIKIHPLAIWATTELPAKIFIAGLGAVILAHDLIKKSKG